MLNFVKKLTQNDFSNLVKEYQVLLLMYPHFEEVQKTFDYEYEAKKYVEEEEKKGLCIYSGLEIRGVKYE
jgi:hypothetical protein